MRTNFLKLVERWVMDALKRKKKIKCFYKGNKGNLC